jgi:hypothetical protein
MITRITSRCLSGTAVMLLSVLLCPRPAAATPADTEWGRIQSIETGWTLPYMHLEMSFPAISPDACAWAAIIRLHRT